MEEQISVEQHGQLVEALRQQLAAGSSQEVELVQTHISSVLLDDQFAYKIKKPMNFGFLNFSTLDLRKHYCEEELRLNKRLAPALYLDVLPITGSIESPQIGGSDPAIEYLVKMTRFDQSQQLDRLLESGNLDPHVLDKIADRIAAFHQEAAVAGPESPFGDPDQVWAPVAQNFEQIRGLIEDPEKLSQVDRIEQRESERFAALKPLLEQRKAEGFIRECHGDMHLGNMTIFEKEPLIFDGIEFNEEFRWIDVISELAFLTMDLTDRGEQQLAQRLMNRYLENTGDYAGLPLLGFYQSYRAVVRAKVASFRLAQDISEEERTAVLSTYQSYMDLAETFTALEHPHLILTHGFSGSGKSTLSAYLLEQLGAYRIRSDKERKRLFAQATHPASGDINAGLYSSELSQATYEHLLTLAKTILQAGYSVIVDAAFLRADQRTPFYELAEKMNLPCTLIQTTSPVEVMRARIQQRRSSSENISDASQKVLDYQLTHSDSPTDAEPLITIDTSGEVDLAGLIEQLR